MPRHSSRQKTKPNPEKPEFGVIGKLEPGIEPSVHAGVTVMAQPLDLILHLQFATFELHDSQVIDRWMGQAFGNFVFERLMSSLQFRKVRLHRHAVCLLNQWPSTI
jgi:hypothetical protein